VPNAAKLGELRVGNWIAGNIVEALPWSDFLVETLVNRHVFVLGQAVKLTCVLGFQLLIGLRICFLQKQVIHAMNLILSLRS